MRTVGIMFVLVLMLMHMVGCGSDFQKGNGSALVYKSELRVLDGPAVHTWGVGKEAATPIAERTPPDFSDSDQYKQPAVKEDPDEVPALAKRSVRDRQ